MPELPELEVLRDLLEERLAGRTVASATPIRAGILKTVEPPWATLDGATLQGVERRGKHLILRFGPDLQLVIHLMVAGRLLLCGSDTRRTQATGFVISWQGGEDLRLVEGGATKRAAVHLVRDPSEVPRIAAAGREPLSPAFTVDALASMAQGRRRQAKKLLTDQREIAGIGSAYADEILFAARISPLRFVNRLTRGEIERLHVATRSVLLAAIEALRRDADRPAVLGDARPFAAVYKRTGQPCPRCATPIAEIRYADTRTYYCPTCQSGGRALPDRRSWLTR
jgi:formamidopyrimidine-DNA glycosylase